MLLSSVNRIKMYAGLGDSIEETRAVARFLNSISKTIQISTLERELELKSYTEYFDTDIGEKEFFPKAFPIVSITSAHTDLTGLYNGLEVAEVNYFKGQYDKSVVFWRNSFGRYEKGLRIIYVGGVATHPVNSVFTLTDLGTSDPEETQYVSTESFSALGVVKSFDNLTGQITIENLYGAFDIGDDLIFSAKEQGDAIENTSGTISAIISQSLVEAKPNIAQAIEMEIDFLQKNKGLFDRLSSSKDGSTTKRAMDSAVYTLQPETKLFLQGEARIWL